MQVYKQTNLYILRYIIFLSRFIRKKKLRYYICLLPLLILSLYILFLNVRIFINLIWYINKLLLATVYTKTIAILWGKSTMAREENHDENDSLSLLGKCRIFTSW